MLTRKISFISLALLAVMLGACLPVTTATGSEVSPRSMTVTGMGQVYLVPDIAYLFIGVHTENASAADALAENSRQVQRVIDTLVRFNIEDVDIQTSNISIWPMQQYDENGRLSGIMYAVDNTVNVTVRDLEALGDLLDAVVQNGANTINGIQFDVAEKMEPVAQARQAAVENAQQQAEQLAEATGVQLGEIQTISYYDSYPATYSQLDRGGGYAPPSAAVPISPGQMTLTTSVTIVYALK